MLTRMSKPDFKTHFLEGIHDFNSRKFWEAHEAWETLWLSACGGGRSYRNKELDPEYKYILEQGEALANRYHDDDEDVDNVDRDQCRCGSLYQNHRH